jgi:two-component system CheB/CheR fusion protein
LILENQFSVNINKEDEEALVEILETIKKETHLNFTEYKRPTIIRRVVRRMAECNIQSFSDYIDYILKNPDEIEHLSKSFLISVTQFFRDPKAFEVLRKKVIPDIIQNKLNVDQIKVWVIGCATGEEAYIN